MLGLLIIMALSIFAGKSLTELTNSKIPNASKSSTSSLINIPSQQQLSQLTPSTLITSSTSSVSSGGSTGGTAVVTNELLAAGAGSSTKKIVHTKTISPPILHIQVKQESSSSTDGFVKPTLNSIQQHNGDALTTTKALASSSSSQPIHNQFTAVKSEPMKTDQQHNDGIVLHELNSLKREGKCVLFILKGFSFPKQNILKAHYIIMVVPSDNIYNIWRSIIKNI